MSSAAPPQPMNPVAPRPAAPPPPTGIGTTAIDPIKLLKKWKYVLVAAVIVGAGLGVVGHFAWLRIHPFFKSEVIYEARPPETPDLLGNTEVNEDALERFMLTEAMEMVRPAVLERVATNPRLRQEAPRWAEDFERDDGTFDHVQATQKLERHASASPISGTNNIKLTVTWKHPEDAAAIARLMSDAYMSQRNQKLGIENRERRDAIQRSIDETKQQIDALTERRSRLIRDEEVTGISEQATTVREKLSLIARERNLVLLEMRAMEVQLQQMNEMVNSESGVRYSDSQRAMVEQSPVVAQLRGTLELLERREKELRRSNYMPEHREVRMTRAQIEATQAQLSTTRERELARLFDAEKDALESMLRQSQAKEADMIARERDLEVMLQDLTRTIREINDITNEIAQLNGNLAERRSSLADLETTTSLESAGRIIRVQGALVPDRRSQPKLPIMLFAGAFLLTGFVGAGILAAEFLDQRVKSASDLATLPRTKILGTIPLAEEDPTGSKHFETMFRDAPRSVLAESFRQIRTGVLKQMKDNKRRTCLVVSGMPGSGSTALVANLGFACATVDERVLLIDANFRRPALHRALGLSEGPGLGDVLAGEATLEQAARAIEGGPHVLTAGSPRNRVFERLGTQPMTELLAEAAGKYDVVFLDTAPAIVAGDARAIAQRCDASLLVTRAMVEKRGMVARIAGEFREAPAEMLGIVVNGVRSAAGGYLKRNIRTSAAYHATADHPGAAPAKKG